MTKISRDVKAGIWYTIGNFVNRGIAFLSTPIFTRLLSKEDYGEFNNFTAWASLLGVTTSLDLYATVSRAYYDYEDDFDTYMSTISWLSIVFSSLCYIVVILFKDWAVDIFGMSFQYINMLFIYLVFSPATQFFMVQQRVSGKYKTAIAVSVGSALFSFVLSVIMVLISHDKLLGRVIGYVLPVAMVNIAIYGLFFSRGKKFIQDRAKYALVISIPLIPHHLSGNMLTSADRVMIKRYCGNADVAIYSFAYNCAFAVTILYTSINQAYVPWLYKKLKENDVASIDKQGRRLLLLFLALIFGIMLLTPEIVYVLGGSKYMEAVPVIPIVMLGCCFQFLYTYYVNLELYCKKGIIVSIGTLTAAGVNVGLNILCIPRYGYQAAAVTTLISYIVLYVIHYIAAKRLPYGNLYNHKILLFIVITFSACSVGVQYFYVVSVLRYCIITVYFIVIGYTAYKYFHDRNKEERI